MVQIIALTGTLAYAGEYRISAVLGSNITDQLLDQNGLSYACTAEQTDLTPLLVRAQKVNDLDTGLQKFRCGSLLFKAGSRSVNRFVANAFRRRLIINRLS